MEHVSENTKARLGLLALPKLGPARARWLLGDQEPAAVLDSVRRGRFPANSDHPPPGVNLRLLTEWAQAARSLNLDRLVEAQTLDGRRILAPTDDAWPFDEDPEPPILLFYIGQLDLLDHDPAVAVVGTRRCTSVGRAVAYEFGASLADAGVAVVSGLALGIDGAAHRGCLDRDGQVVGVVGTGLDVVYPGANRGLWADVSTSGLLLTEALAGTRPQRWRFPARNRLIAALCKAVVVVESHDSGGSLLTVDECLDRDRTVFVVPGSVASPASDGVNRLLIEGATPARDAMDVLGALNYQPHKQTRADQQQRLLLAENSSPATNHGSLQQLILNEASAAPTTIDILIAVSGTEPSEVVAELQRMAAQHLIEVDGSIVSAISQRS